MSNLLPGETGNPFISNIEKKNYIFVIGVFSPCSISKSIKTYCSFHGKSLHHFLLYTEGSVILAKSFVNEFIAFEPLVVFLK